MISFPYSALRPAAALVLALGAVPLAIGCDRPTGGDADAPAAETAPAPAPGAGTAAAADPNAAGAAGDAAAGPTGEPEPAAAGESAGGGNGQISDAELDAFLKAYLRIAPLEQKARKEIQKAEKAFMQTRAEQIEANTRQTIIRILADSGISNDEYRRMVKRLNEDPELSRRARARAEAVAAEIEAESP